MSFTPSGTIVTVQATTLSGSVYNSFLGNGVLISGNEVLISNQIVQSAGAAGFLTIVIDPSTASPSSIGTSSIPGGQTYTVSISSTHSTGNNAPGQNLAVIYLGANVDLTSTVGYMGLAEDSTLQQNTQPFQVGGRTEVGVANTLYMYGYQASGGGQSILPINVAEITSSTNQTDSGITANYKEFDIQSTTTPDYQSSSIDTIIAGAMDVTSIQGPRGLGNSVMTPTAVAQIEYWQALDGNSPAIQRLYHTLLGRTGSAAEISYYSTTYASEEVSTAGPGNYASSAQVFSAHQDLPQAFLNSAEFASKYPSATTTDGLISLLYQNALGRAPSSAETTYYENLVAAGETRAQLVGVITGSPEAIAHSGVWGQTNVAY